MLDKVLINKLASKNRKFEKLFNQIGIIDIAPRNLDFASMVKIIINQQLSNKVAEIIYKRLHSLSVKVRPENILDLGDEELRKIGISYSKIKFIKDLAIAFLKNPNLIQSWRQLDDASALIEIQKLNGFGKWSANIILLFYLQRDDIFPDNDSTLNRAYEKIYGKKSSKNLEEIEWVKTNRSLLARYLWKWVDKGMKDLS